MDMMFNTEMIVKDMKGGKEDMTENKRFLIDDAGELIDLNNHKFIDYGDECCKLLNELSDENERLKIFLKALNEESSLANRDCDILEEENEQLKAILKQFTGSKYNDTMGIN